MSDADRLNETLARELPAAWRCLSPLGRAAAFPRGIPFQASEARGAKINATIGQLTDGSGSPLPLGPFADLVNGLDPHQTFLYAPVEGPAGLRKSWGARERRMGGVPDSTGSSLPFVTHGLTHGLSLLADLFADPETDVVVPSPAWENYELVFGMHAGARVVNFPFFRGDRFNVEGLADALHSVRSAGILILNFPGNPTGYQPDPEEARRIVEVVAAHPGPLVAITDDAYQGWVYTPGRQERSLFWDLCEAADPERLLPIKIDGATKELVFFGSRVGFLTHSGTGAAEDALLSKLKFLVRGTVGSASGPALAMIQEGLTHPDLDAAFEERRQLLAGRWRALHDGLASLDNPRARPRPFHGAFFALLELSDGLDADAVRKDLLARHSVGTIAFPEDNALRVAYCSIREDQISELVSALRVSLA